MTGLPVGFETRSDGPRHISGYAAVFFKKGEEGTQFHMGETLTERIDPGAFDSSLKEHDVRALFNHEPANLLGRTGSGTLRLSVDKVGLRYDIDLPETRLAQDLAHLIQRGDITGSSFGFVATEERFDRQSDGHTFRYLESVRLLDVGPVTYEAYTATAAEVRAVLDLSRAGCAGDEAIAIRKREIELAMPYQQRYSTQHR